MIRRTELDRSLDSGLSGSHSSNLLDDDVSKPTAEVWEGRRVHELLYHVSSCHSSEHGKPQTWLIVVAPTLLAELSNFGDAHVASIAEALILV